MCITRSLYGSVSDPNGPSIPDVTNDQVLWGNACLNSSYVEYDWQLSISDYQFIIKPLVTYIVANSDSSLCDSGTFYVTENTTMSLTMNSLMIWCIDVLYSPNREVASSIATDDDSLTQNTDNWVNQQISVIEESNRHLNEIDDFMRLLKNLRGGITQIVKRQAKVDIDNTEQATAGSEGIYYLDANNLYGGAMHRMMPYELVGVPERQEVMEKINRDPNGWVQSLKTFGKVAFFIECDIEAPIELHDKFNDLPFFPVQKAGIYSDGIKKYAKKNE